MIDPTVPFSFFPGLRELTELYEELDRQIAQFKKGAELDCPKHCQKCCAAEGTRIEVSAFECLPLAVHLWRLGEAEFYLQEIAESREEDPCVLHNLNHPRGDSWGCKHYAWRPLICRLFGFSAILDKRGEKRIAMCRSLKEADPQAEKRASQRMAEGLQVPILADGARKASFLDPHLGEKRYSINRGLKIALEKVGLRSHLFAGENDSKGSPFLNRRNKGSPANDREDA
jgi:Fe-S-cluster containining protein